MYIQDGVYDTPRFIFGFLGCVQNIFETFKGDKFILLPHVFSMAFHIS